jgi:hypothetical protein
LHLRSEPAKALKNISLLGTSKWATIYTTQKHILKSISSSSVRISFSTQYYNQNQNQVKKKYCMSLRQNLPLSNVENGSWLPLAREYVSIYSE